MYLYHFENINSSNLDQIHIDIENSLELNNKEISWCRWDEDILILTIGWNGELLDVDALILADIIYNNSEYIE
jgi:hypothetical protein